MRQYLEYETARSISQAILRRAHFRQPCHLRVTYVYKEDDEFIGEVSLVFDTNDLDYTIDKRRIYVSHLIVKPEKRRNGIGKRLVEYATDKAKEMGYSEMSIGVDLDNYPALKLYADSGFDNILFIGEDHQGKYVKLLKKI